MTDALVSNKPDFVRLFVDSGADMAEFLTYGRLQQLYHSVSPKSLLFELLQRKHEEGRLTLAGLGAQQARELPIGLPAFSLHEVSRVLKDFLHDACRGFYQDGRRAEVSRARLGQGVLSGLNVDALFCRREGRPSDRRARSGYQTSIGRVSTLGGTCSSGLCCRTVMRWPHTSGPW